MVYFLVGLFFLEWLGGAPYPFALSCVEGLGLGCLGALACWGMAYEFPSTSLHSAVLRSASLRTNGGAGAPLRMHGRGSTSVRPAVSKGWGMALRRGSGQAYPRAPILTFPHRGEGIIGLLLGFLFLLEWLGGAPVPFALSCVEGLGLAYPGAPS